MRFWICLLVITLASFFLQGENSVIAQSRSQSIDRLMSATVQVIQAREISDNLVETCVGSGTLVWRDGLILTNAHIVQQTETCDGDKILIAISKRLDEPPVPSFRAQLVQIDSKRDLAILQIHQELDGRSLDPRTLTLPFVEVGNSDEIQLDQTVLFLGYPGIGDTPIQDEEGANRGTINGFLAEPSGGNRAWLKTNLQIPGLMSGGGVYDLEGRLIGIPTSSPLITGGSGQCIPLRDSNSDGLVDDGDRCIPIGTDSNAIRPVNMVLPLLRAATLGLEIDESLDEPSPLGLEPRISRLFFATNVRDGQPNSVVDALPSNPTSLYLFFDYENMRLDTVYEIRVIVEGVPNQALSLAPVRWSGEKEGTWHIGTSGSVLPNGRYQYTVFVDGSAAATRSIQVGGTAGNTPRFTDIVFGIADESGSFSGSGYLLPVGEIATARFIYQNIPPGMPWQARWYYEGVISSVSEGNWLDGVNGVKEISIAPLGGLLPGRYRLELGIENRLAATADFIIAGIPPASLPKVFDNLQFVAAESRSAVLTAIPTNTFVRATSSIFVLFDWRQLAQEMPWQARWFVDDNLFHEQKTLWSGTANGSGILTQLRASNLIPEGRYRLELVVAGITVSSSEFTVGIGQLPIDEISEPSGIQLIGQVVDAETGEGIAGASFILISEDYAIDDWEWVETQVFDRTRSDIQGNFQFDRILQYRTPYSVYVLSRGYLPVTADGFIVTDTTSTPLDLYIEMVRDRP